MAKYGVKPSFRRDMDFVALRPFAYKGVVVQPGDSIESKGANVMRYHYRLNRIGPKNHPWTEFRLKRAAAFAPAAPLNDKAPVKDDSQEPAKAPQKKKGRGAKISLKLPEQENGNG